MNAFFMICFLFLMVLLLVINKKLWISMNGSMKRAYFIIYAVTFGLYVFTALGYTVPMPTHFFNARQSSVISPILHESR